MRRELAEGIGSLPGWLKGVSQKKTKTCWKIIGGSRKAYREFLGFDLHLKKIGSGCRCALRRRTLEWT
ncbi:hypothetical protein B296_00038494 [Ensete ventricosum]|uniref:Uncharacterized protein n=1 Tax=Ensete ventricosum TaxID=4639 RepID=A0A426XL95_ENSVE|nr:hypothetical protein B296_00038494 [Ensete ventricosum]